MKIIKALSFFIKNPVFVIKKGAELQKENWHKKRIQKCYNKSQLPTIDFLDINPSLNETIDYYSYLSGTALIPDIVLLKSLARKFDKCNYLEIGSWRGESIVNVAQVADKCLSVTLGAEEMRKIGLSDDFINIHGFFSKNQKNITTIFANSHHFNFEQLNEKFDLIFIDGDHTYEGVLNDTVKTFNLRKNENAIIVWHDYSNNVEDVRYSVLHAILDGVPKEKHGNLYHVSNTLCAIYIENVNYKTFFSKFPTIPNKSFEVQVKGKKLV